MRSSGPTHPPHTHAHTRATRGHTQHAHTTPHNVSVVTAGEPTPGPIPNPEAKTPSADGTAPARVRESRTPPSTNHTPARRLPPHTTGGRASGRPHTHHTPHPEHPPEPDASTSRKAVTSGGRWSGRGCVRAVVRTARAFPPRPWSSIQVCFRDECLRTFSAPVRPRYAIRACRRRARWGHGTRASGRGVKPTGGLRRWTSMSRPFRYGARRTQEPL